MKLHYLISTFGICLPLLAHAEELKVTSEAVRKAWKDRGAMFDPSGEILFTLHEKFDLAGLPVPEGNFQVRLSPAQFEDPAFKPIRTAKTLVGVHLKSPGEFTEKTLPALQEVPELRNLVIWKYVTVDPKTAVLFSKLSNLESATLSLKFNDDIFRSLAKLKSLKNLYLTEADNITGTGLKELRGLHNLSLHQTRVNDDVILQLKELTELETLNLSFAFSITDKGIAGLSSLKRLSTLNLAHTNVTDAAMPLLPKSLKSLNLAEVRRISDKGLKSLEEMPDLGYLKLSDTEVTSGGIAALKAKLPKCVVVND